MFTDVEMAILSQAAYRDCKNPPKTLNEFLRDNETYLREELGENYTDAINELLKKTEQYPYKVVASKNDSKSGFAAFAVEGPNHEVTVACRGTEFGKLKTDPFEALKDLAADGELAFAQNSAQQKNMKAFVEDLEKNGYAGYYFTGHSLGGNIAMHGAATMHNPTLLKGVVTFNAPGYNLEYLQVHQGDLASIESKSVSYQNKRDAISETLTVPGKVIILDCTNPKATGMEAHMLDHFVIDDAGDNFKYSAQQVKETTKWGQFFEGLGITGNVLNTVNPIDVKENALSYIEHVKGTTIKVPLSTLQENARIMRELTDTNADLFDRVYNSLDCLRESDQWKGLAVNEAIFATQLNKEKFAQTVADMKELADFLTRFSEAMADEDTRIQNRIVAVCADT